MRVHVLGNCPSPAVAILSKAVCTRCRAWCQAVCEPRLLHGQRLEVTPYNWTRVGLAPTYVYTKLPWTKKTSWKPSHLRTMSMTSKTWTSALTHFQCSIAWVSTGTLCQTTLLNDFWWEACYSSRHPINCEQHLWFSGIHRPSHHTRKGNPASAYTGQWWLGFTSPSRDQRDVHQMAILIERSR